MADPADAGRPGEGLGRKYAPLTMPIKESIEKLERKESLSRGEAQTVMEALLSGTLRDDTIAALLVGLREKGESAEEIAGFASVMRARAGELLEAAGVNARELASTGPLLDTCGTGGDSQGTFNVSTATAMVAAACGARVAKHGNRSISSRCGSADVLEALGVEIELPLHYIPECLDRIGMVFLFAPHLHTAMKHVMNARRSLKTKTVFNLLGPLTNPLGASTQLAGVYDRALTEMMAHALASMGAGRAFVVTSLDGMDEISIAAPTQLSETNNGIVRTRHIRPEDFGLAPASSPALAGGEAEANARILRDILEGEQGAHRDMLLANSAAALVVSGRAGNFLEGVAMAREAIDSGAARHKLARLIDFTQKHRP
jgi:anthranilate phosphoribosyltransferase